MSWVPQLRESRFFQTLDGFFSYLLAPIRKIIPPIGGTIDISPIILMVGLSLLVNFLMGFFH
jgi:YggT family protein